MFMHSSFTHLLFNMFNLYMFGSTIERNLGKDRFLFIYGSAGLGAVILYYLTMTSSYGVMLGASGAVYGLMTAFAVCYPNVQFYMMFIPVPIKAKYLVGFYFLLDFYSGMNGSMGDVAHWAHVGGGVIGFLIAMFWKAQKT